MQTLESSKILRSTQEQMLTIHQKLSNQVMAIAEIAQLNEDAKLLKNYHPNQAKQFHDIAARYTKIQSVSPIAIDDLKSITYRGEELLAQMHEYDGQRILNQTNDLNDNISKLSTWILVICLMVGIFAIALGRVIANALAKSLAQLKQAAKNLNEGNYAHRVQIEANNEFGKLSQTFNKLAGEAEQAEIIEKQNEELEHLNQQLKLKNDSLDSFVYRVSHDLKAPLINLISLQKLIKTKIDLDDEVMAKTFSFMERSSEKLHQSIYDLLEVSRIERNLGNQKEWNSLIEVTNDVMEENMEEIQRSGTKVHIDFAAAEGVHFNKANLKSIVANLITNAIKYRKKVGTNIIKASSRVLENGNVVLQIADNGIGLDTERHKEKLFGIFSRFHNHVEGSGVGLYIVKKLIEENGGSIHIDSAVGEGTTFEIEFPSAQNEKKLEQKEMAR